MSRYVTIASDLNSDHYISKYGNRVRVLLKDMKFLRPKLKTYKNKLQESLKAIGHYNKTITTAVQNWVLHEPTMLEVVKLVQATKESGSHEDYVVDALEAFVAAAHVACK